MNEKTTETKIETLLCDLHATFSHLKQSKTTTFC